MLGKLSFVVTFELSIYMCGRQVSVSACYIRVWKPLKSWHLCRSFRPNGEETDLYGLETLSAWEAQGKVVRVNQYF